MEQEKKNGIKSQQQQNKALFMSQHKTSYKGGNQYIV